MDDGYQAVGLSGPCVPRPDPPGEETRGAVRPPLLRPSQRRPPPPATCSATPACWSVLSTNSNKNISEWRLGFEWSDFIFWNWSVVKFPIFDMFVSDAFPWMTFEVSMLLVIDTST